MNRADKAEESVLVLTPTGRDASATVEVLRRAGHEASACADVGALVASLANGVGIVLVAEEGLLGHDLDPLAAWVGEQPPWSDLPFLMLTSDREAPAIRKRRERMIARLQNVVLIERPVQPLTLLSAVGSALRARRRQYQVRSHLLERQRAEDDLERRVAERTAELLVSEDSLRQSQKMEAVGQLTGGIAHDFNNLLAGISGSLELLQTRMAQGRLKDLDRYISTAEGCSKRAAALTHRLLAFSRRQTLDPKPMNVNGLVAGMEELIRRTVGPSIAVEVVGAVGLWTVLIDPHQLENALLNLTINARDAMPAGGRITIETANKWLDERIARERDMPAGQYIALSVTDTGTGMPTEIIARAFDPFFTTKPVGEGTGLGLSMIYGFVRQSGGQVRIYSELGLGTTLCLYLPRHYGDADQADAVGELREAPRAEEGQTVLIVDDEASIRMLVTEVLEDLGYIAIEAADGSAALKVLQSDVRLDLLVTDVGLPGGLNGRQVADAGRAARPDLKVLFITGYAENAVLGNGHLDPGMHVLTKPFVLDTLVGRIKDLILDR
ncbi:ATP-binding protein [Methylobacterium sp.]|jgi:signal transduction histidine kinase/CheY-like chemotaxis protein|uniref:ATP-binding protein n=1 Tax=Methylobacterium sp. TaxID=409 RepID=UPI003458D9DC|nr:putative Histidine kinase [Methylobacterium sp.]